MNRFDVEDPSPETAPQHCGQRMQAMQPWTEDQHKYRCVRPGCTHREKVRFNVPSGPGDVAFGVPSAGAGARVPR